MNEENITFGGQEADKLTAEKVNEAIKSLRTYSTLDVAQISHNCTKEKFMEVLGIVENAPIETENPALFGMPVYVKSYIPLGEIWLQNKDGQIIKKFSVG